MRIEKVNLQKAAVLTMATFTMLNLKAYAAFDNIFQANQQTGDRTYEVKIGTESLTQSLSQTGYGTLNVIGSGKDSILSGEINSSTNGSFFKLTSTTPTTLNLKDLTITQAIQNNAGGSVIVLQNGNTANLDNVTLKENSAFASGGAIYSSNGNLIINDSIFDNNSSTNSTAGVIVVYGNNGNTEIYNSIFENNKAPNTGVIYITSSNLILKDSVFRNNESSSTLPGSNPGAIRLGNGDGVTSLIERCSFDNNISGNNAGAVYSYGNTTIKDSSFTNNYANFRGGALIVGTQSNTQITGTTFNGNQSQEFAGAIYNDGNLTIDNSTISNNKALHHEPTLQDGRGGAIYNSGTGILNLNQGTQLINNSAAGEGGAIANSTNGIVNITGTSIVANKSDTDGGGIWNIGQITINGGTNIADNSAQGQGGGIFNTGTVNLTSDENGNIIFQNNNSSAGANDIYNTKQINVNGETGAVVINSGVSGQGFINKYGDGALLLHGDNSNYTGTFNQNDGTTAISDGKWFTGDSSIEGGTLEWGQMHKKQVEL